MDEQIFNLLVNYYLVYTISEFAFIINCKIIVAFI